MTPRSMDKTASRVSDERLAQMLESARRLEISEWVSVFSELQSLRSLSSDSVSDGSKGVGVTEDEIARIVDPHSFRPIDPVEGDESVADMVQQGKDLARSKARRILSAITFDSGTGGQQPVAFNWTREMYQAFSAIQGGVGLPNMAELVALWDALHGAVEFNTPTAALTAAEGREDE